MSEKIDSFWFKEYSDIPLTEVMERTMSGESVYPSSPPNPEFGEITKYDLLERELEVVRELTCNLTNEEIAEELHISPHTVKRYIENILTKTGFKSRVELAVNAKSMGLVVSDRERTSGSLPSNKGGGAK